MSDRLRRDEYEFHIEPFGRNAAMWNLYTQLTFCYSLNDASHQSEVVSTLTKGLNRLTKSFPWIAGQVVRETREETGNEYYLIKSFEPIPKFVVKDLSNVLPPLESYRQSGYPIALLDENAIAPRNTKSISDEADPKPVFLLQATFITNGLLLTLLGQHGTLDIMGQGEMIRLLSKACHDEPFTDEEIELGNRDRRTVVPLLSEQDEKPTNDKASSEPNPAPPQRISKSTSQEVDSAQDSSMTENVWTNFIFSGPSLQALKSFAIESTTLTSTFISTDDALSAFIWQCISRARLPRSSPTDTSTFARTVDVRRYLTIAPTYPGNLATKTYSTYTFQQLQQQPLGAVASQLRSTVDPKTSNLAYEARAAATALSKPSRSHNNTSSSSSKRPRDLSKDIAFSSWAKIGYCHDLDFNLGLGRPEAVRRPSFAPPNEQPMEGLVYLLPKKPDGEIVVVVCLRMVDMQRLNADEEWLKYARVVG